LLLNESSRTKWWLRWFRGDRWEAGESAVDDQGTTNNDRDGRERDPKWGAKKNKTRTSIRVPQNARRPRASGVFFSGNLIGWTN